MKAAVGVTSLHLAVNKGANIQQNFGFYNAKFNLCCLHLQLGYERVVQILVGNRADVNAQGKDKETPLHMAVGNGKNCLNFFRKGHKFSNYVLFSKGFEKIVKMLIENKADVNAKYKDGMTSLHLTAENGTNYKLLSESSSNSIEHN